MKRAILNFTATLAILLTIYSTGAQAQGKFVYTNNDRVSNNSVSGFKVKADGTLELLPGMPVGTDGGGGSIDSFGFSNDKIKIIEKGPYLFASSDGDQEVATFKIDPNTGALTFITTKNLGDDGNDSDISIAVSPNEKFLYAANPNDHTIRVLAINDDGTLTELQVESVGDDFRPLNMSVSPDNRFLAVTLFHGNADPNGKLAMYTIAFTGTISPAPGSPFNGSGAGRVADTIFNCESNRLYVGKNFTDNMAVDVYNVSENGSVSQINGSPFVFNIGGLGGALAISPDGKRLFVGNGFNSVAVTKIGANGGLTLGVFSPFPGSPDEGSIHDLGVDASGKFLFVTHVNQKVETFRINADDTLTLIEGSLVSTNEDSGLDTSTLDSLAVYPLAKKCQIKAPDDIAADNDLNQCGATVNYPAATICGEDCGEVTCDPPSGSFFAVGTHTVTCSAKGAGDASFKITVTDKQSPSFSCPINITVPTDQNKCSAKVNFKLSATDNCDGNPVIEIDFPSGTEFPKGETTVHVKATDKAGNFSTCEFKVKVVDQQAPSVNCQADINVNNEPNKCGSAVNYPLPTVSDNCPGVGAPICNPPSGSFFPLGTTNVTCTVKDAANNAGECTFKVTVKDVQPPTISCPSDVTVVTPNPCDAGVVVNYPSPMANDNCPNNLMVVCNPPSGSFFPVGTTNVTCVVTDGGGNQAQCGFKITIFDVRLQDDSDPNTVLLFNSFTGDYRICSPNLPQPVTGKGTILKQGCTSTLQHNAPDRKLLAKADPAVKKGNASLQMPPGTQKASIIDKDISNNTTLCK